MKEVPGKDQRKYCLAKITGKILTCQITEKILFWQDRREDFNPVMADNRRLRNKRVNQKIKNDNRHIKNRIYCARGECICVSLCMHVRVPHLQ